MLTLKHLSAKRGDLELLRNINLEIRPATCTLMMGPNGSGKTSLVRVIVGDSQYQVVDGELMLERTYSNSGEVASENIDLLQLSPHERSRRGIFVSFQHPVELPGVSSYEFLFASYKALYPEEGKDLDVDEMRGIIENAADDLGINESMLSRGVNEGFSGGERKKLELLQMIVLQPSHIILDEPDSGLDADSVKMISRSLKLLNNAPGIFIISHDARRLGDIHFDSVCIMREGTIAEYGGDELIERVQKHGYE